MTLTTSTRSRAERLRLLGRAELARHAADLLHSKETALERERVRLEGHAVRADQNWKRQCLDATTWLLRARMMGASGDLAALARHPVAAATIDAQWQRSMGITYPGSVDCVPAPAPPVVSTAALAPTTDAYRRALEAAAQQAATSAALQRLDAELADTRRRRRAIEERLLPRLEAELHDLELHLDEQDREEGLRVRLATQRRE